ncbi:hypothetical protein HGM15179_019938, partial [Zosterops borbonicus]
CWTGKQLNIISNIISDLVTDVGSVRHAVLQNRAAIDFLLLAQGHECEEFEGLCCMNLDNMHKLQTESDPFMSWLTHLGLTPWLVSLVRTGLLMLAVIIIILLIVPCVMQCMQQLANQ